MAAISGIIETLKRIMQKQGDITVVFATFDGGVSQGLVAKRCDFVQHDTGKTIDVLMVGGSTASQIVVPEEIVDQYRRYCAESDPLANRDN